MRIGELAEAVGVSADTIRFYEKRGLLGDALYTRKANNYRNYDESAVDYLRTILRAKTLGFTLSEILELGTLWTSGRLSLEDRVKILEQKLAELEVKKQALTELQRTIEEKVKRLKTLEETSSEPVR